MTAIQPNQPSNQPTDNLNPTIPGFDDLAFHLSQQTSTSPFGTVVTNTPSRPLSLHRPAETSAARTVEPVAPAEPDTQEPAELPLRKSLHQRDRFAGDPCDDVRLQWADDSPEWWHFDVEARMVDRETLWIMEQLEALFQMHLKPVWWDRFVEGINDFLTTIFNELLHPAWTLIAAPLRWLAQWIPDIDWPWNFELRGPNVSVKQSPFRRLVFDNQLAAQVVERLWNDPDEFLEAGQTVTRDDYAAVARVPVHAPQADGHFADSAIGLLKRFNLRSVLHTLTRVLLFTRGSRSWTYGRELLNAGLGTARPLAMVEDRLGPFRLRSFVLNEQVVGTPLPEFLATTELNTLELDRLAGQFARIWHTLGEIRIVHGAMHAANFLVTPTGQLQLINLDSTWRHWFDVTFLHRRDRDWLRFMKAWRGQPEIGAAFRAAVARHFEETAVAQRQLIQPLTVSMQRAA